MATTNICNNSLLEKIIKKTDNADNPLLPDHHLIKNINSSWETKFKGIILSPFMHPPPFTNNSNVLWLII